MAHFIHLHAHQLVEIEFSAVVTDVASNARPGRYRNRAEFDWEDDRGGARSQRDTVATQIVEPNLVAGKTDDDVDGVMQPGQTVTYSVTVGNASGAQVSVAHDVAVVDTVPDELTVLDREGAPAVTGSTSSCNSRKTGQPYAPHLRQNARLPWCSRTTRTRTGGWPTASGSTRRQAPLSY